MNNSKNIWSLKMDMNKGQNVSSLCFLPSLRLGHITDAYPLELRPVLQEIASLRSATSDTLIPLRQQYSQEVKHEGKQLFTSIKTIFPFISF